MSKGFHLNRVPVIIESPFAGNITANLNYLRRCILSCIARDEAPFASHGFYTQFLNDSNTDDRITGIECGLVWSTRATLIAFYTDLGWSPGMREALNFHLSHNHEIQIRALDGPPQLLHPISD